MKKSLLIVLCLFLGGVLFAQIPQGYYDGTDGLSGEQLKAALNNIIQGHTSYPYSSTSTDVWDILKEADRDPNNANNVIGLYSGFSMDAAAEYNNGDGWNREHVWAKSRGDFGTTQGAGTDLHHLRAADISTNSARNNRSFAESANEPYVDASGSYNGPTGSFTSSSEYVWKPRAEVRGDVARMIFYMATRYEGAAGEPDLELTDLILSNTDKSPLHGRLSDLLLWHQQDPVDDAERNRNDIVYSYQNNRNPFIDHPEFVALIWGGSQSTAPFFTSTPITSGSAGVAYQYNVTSGGGAGAVSISGSTLPTWLTLTDNGDGTATLSGTPGASGTYPVILNITDGTDSDTQSFDITVTSNGGGSGSATDLLFSEYIEGSSFNKALEVANFTGSAVNLSSYQIKKQTNGAGSWSGGLPLTGTLADGDVYVVANSSANAAILSQADYSGGNGELTFNGNDALGLFKDGVLIDAIGVFNSAATFGQDVTLIRNADINSPNTTYTISEWTSFGTDTFSNLGSHTMNTGSTPNVAPSVYITAPSNGTSYTTGDLVNVTANASDADGSVVSVEFFANNVSIGTDTSAPYSATFNIAEGSSDITAVATDDDGATTTSTIVGVIATTPNVAPSVSITSPSNGSTFTDGDNVSISVSASDSDGTVTSVEFFVDGVSIGTDTNAPYTGSFIIGVGNFVISAIATDNDGATTSSGSVSVTGQQVSTPTEVVLAYDNFESGWGSYRDGGADAYLYTVTTFAWAGSSAGGIQDNSGANSSFYSNSGYDVTGFDLIEVEFYFYPRSMENGEDFWLRFYDGSAWQTVASWVSGTDFSNNNFYVTTVAIDASSYNFSANAQFRFQCDASANADDVYIDEITITAFNTGSARLATNSVNNTTLVKEGNKVLNDMELSIYPNPVANTAILLFNSDESEDVTLQLIDIQGRIVESKAVKVQTGLNEISLDLMKYEEGVYLLKIIQEDEITVKQIVKSH